MKLTEGMDLKPQTIKLLKELLGDKPTKKNKKTGPDPKLKYDIDWFEGSDNPHAEFNKQKRLEKEDFLAKRKALNKQKVNLCDLTHEQWEILASDHHYDKEMKRLNEVANMFSKFGYNRVYEFANCISNLLVVKDGGKMVKGIIVTAGEEDGDGTIYPGIQLTKTVVKTVKGDMSNLTFSDCIGGISYRRRGEDSYFSGDTHRWGFDYKDINLTEFIKKLGK